jgi:Sulfatase
VAAATAGEGQQVGWRGFGPFRRELESFAELFALCGVAVVEPTLDLLSKNATLLVTLRATKVQTVMLVALVMLVPPVSIWLVEVTVGLLVPSARRPAHAVLAAGIVGVLAVEALKHQTDLDRAGLVAGATVAAAATAVLVLRVPVVRLWLRFLAIAPLAFAVLFLVSTPVSNAVFDDGPQALQTRIGTPSRVVMIVLDELPLESLLDGTGHVNAKLFPNFAALAGDSTWYRNSTTVAPNTELAVPSILTGQIPTDQYALPVAGVHPRNLFTLLGGTYRMNVHETVTRLCPPRLCGQPVGGGGRHGLDALVHDTAVLWRQFASPTGGDAPITFDASSFSGASVPAGLGFVDSLQPDSRPQLDFLHILLPHQPWHVRARFRDDDVHRHAQGVVFTSWGSDAAASSARQRHLLQLQATDELVGEVVARLKRVGAYERSLVVLTADHGVAFSSGNPIRGVSSQNWPQILWTPLFIKTPGQKVGHIDDRPAESVDVLPTIADLLDVKTSWKFDGHSLRGDVRPDGPRPIFEWWANAIKPQPGQHLLTFDGPSGFASVLQQGSPVTSGDPSLALYRLGPYGGLVGQSVDRLIDPSTKGPRGTMAVGGDIDHVHRGAEHIPWAYGQGKLRAQGGSTVAVAVDGRVAGTATTVGPALGPPRSAWWSTLAPQLFRDGKNDVRAYLVTGTPSAPQLVAIQSKR